MAGALTPRETSAGLVRPAGQPMIVPPSLAMPLSMSMRKSKSGKSGTADGEEPAEPPILTTQQLRERARRLKQKRTQADVERLSDDSGLLSAAIRSRTTLTLQSMKDKVRCPSAAGRGAALQPPCQRGAPRRATLPTSPPHGRPICNGSASG